MAKKIQSIKRGKKSRMKTQKKRLANAAQQMVKGKSVGLPENLSLLVMPSRPGQSSHRKPRMSNLPPNVQRAVRTARGSK